MKKIKITRDFSIENENYISGQTIIVNDNFGGSPNYYQIISITKPKANTRQRKRIPNRAIKSRNTAITNKDKG